jgi:hypothetical protein
MKLGIMQPYFLPYVGYFQLISACDVFVVYDNIKYTKSGWINRNRILRNGEPAPFSLPLKKASDFLDIRDRELSADFDRGKLLRQIHGAYARAPQFADAFPLVEQIVGYDRQNLFDYIRNSIACVCTHLNIPTEIRVSSEIDTDHSLKNQDRIIGLCYALAASTYINAIGGVDLYSREEFDAQSLELKFIRPKPFEYPQWSNGFVSSLSIVDVLMFNPLQVVQRCVAENYELI